MCSYHDATEFGPGKTSEAVPSFVGRPNTPADSGPTRILIVDDSSTMQRLLSRIFSEHPDILVVGCASDGLEALDKISKVAPHVVTLDIDMPGMDGIETLRLIRERNPNIRVVMCSSATERGTKATLDALMAGASHCVAKPGSMQASELAGARFAEEITRKVCLHRTRNAGTSGLSPSRPEAAIPRNAADARIVASAIRIRPEVLAIGTSTGGPGALTDILPMLPKGFPLPILIVQHMPPVFTLQLAERLSRFCKIPVVEGEHGMEVKPGVAIIAPGDYHMTVVRKLHRVEVCLNRDEAENSCRPAVDVLFRSIASVYGRSVIAAVLTGMGQDGLQGVRALKALDNPVLVQDQATSVVWGMPKAISDAGLADAVLPLKEIIPEILRRL